jgi:hypothetical protein
MRWVRHDKWSWYLEDPASGVTWVAWVQCNHLTMDRRGRLGGYRETHRPTRAKWFVWIAGAPEEQVYSVRGWKSFDKAKRAANALVRLRS